jgi:hypothetical protein
MRFLAGWLWWSIATTHWRLWALERVRNIHDLFDHARQDGLIYAEGSWFGRMEIRTKGQRERMEALAVRFNVPDERADDPDLPGATVIHYSKLGTGFTIVMGLLAIGLSIWFLSGGAERNPVFHALIGLFGIYMVYSGSRKFFDNRPQLIISSKGITIAGKSRYSWLRIADEEVVTTGTSKNSKTLLRFSHPTGKVELNINELATSKAELRHALKIHRHRWTLDQPAGRDRAPRS